LLALPELAEVLEPAEPFELPADAWFVVGAA
jgi:hypothetical protein